MDGMFDRQKILIGESGNNVLKNSSVAVFGVGGVGSYVVEALARAGVGTIALVDNDRVSVSNINRQLPAMHSTLGRFKTDVMSERIKDINPQAAVYNFNEFYTEDNCDFIDLASFDYIVDAIDTVSSKLLLICKANQLDIPIISCMGAGNRLDPTRFKVTDIYKTEGCPLARVMRYELRKRGIKKLSVVFSDEPAIKRSQMDDNEKTVGSISFVPSCAGLIAAGHVINQLISLGGRGEI